MSNYFKLVQFLSSFNENKQSKDVLEIRNESNDEICIIISCHNNKFNIELLKLNERIVKQDNAKFIKSSSVSLEDILDSIEDLLCDYNTKLNNCNIKLLIYSYRDKIATLRPATTNPIHYERGISNYIKYDSMDLDYNKVAAMYLRRFLGYVGINKMSESAAYHFRRNFNDWLFKNINPQTGNICKDFKKWEKDCIESAKRNADETKLAGFWLEDRLINLDYAKENYNKYNSENYILIEEEMFGNKYYQNHIIDEESMYR